MALDTLVPEPVPAPPAEVGTAETLELPSALDAPPFPASPIGRNRNFNIFWAGQTFSVLGDAFSVIALPLLVLQATGSVAQMGIVTALFGVGQLVAGLIAGAVVDRVDRRRLMLGCDLGRAVLYGLIPLGWLLVGPQLLLVYGVAVGAALLGMFFQVAYITAIPNLVDRSQLTTANARLQTTFALSFMVGPMLAGLVAAQFGAVTAIGIDAATFLVSAGSLALMRLRQAAATRPAESGGRFEELIAGARFLWRQPVLRAIALLAMGTSLLLAGGLDLFIYHLKHDLGQTDTAVGLVFGLGSVGSVLGGLLVTRVRRRWGFGVCWLGGLLVGSLTFSGIGFAESAWVIALLAMVFTFADTFRGVTQMSLRQEITPDHLLGRVTAAFWMLAIVPGPVGAALSTALAARLGAPVVLGLMGLGGLGLAVLGLLTPVRMRRPEQWTAGEPPGAATRL